MLSALQTNELPLLLDSVLSKLAALTPLPPPPPPPPPLTVTTVIRTNRDPRAPPPASPTAKPLPSAPVPLAVVGPNFWSPQQQWQARLHWQRYNQMLQAQAAQAAALSLPAVVEPLKPVEPAPRAAFPAEISPKSEGRRWAHWARTDVRDLPSYRDRKRPFRRHKSRSRSRSRSPPNDRTCTTAHRPHQSRSRSPENRTKQPPAQTNCNPPTRIPATGRHVKAQPVARPALTRDHKPPSSSTPTSTATPAPLLRRIRVVSVADCKPVPSAPTAESKPADVGKILVPDPACGKTHGVDPACSKFVRPAVGERLSVAGRHRIPRKGENRPAPAPVPVCATPVASADCATVCAASVASAGCAASILARYEPNVVTGYELFAEDPIRFLSRCARTIPKKVIIL